MLLMGKLTVSMAMFNSYVKSPEGNPSGHDVSRLIRPGEEVAAAFHADLGTTVDGAIKY